jgi:RNA polymerase sigma factor (sigma-70 family)
VSSRRRASDLAYAELRRLERPVLAVVNRRLLGEKISLPSPDLEAAYNQAWHGVCQTVAQGREVENLMSLLVTITYRRAIDAYRRRRREVASTTAFLEERALDGDFAERVDDQLKVNRLIGQMSQRLTRRERTAVALCALHGYKRSEAAKRLGVRDARMHKIMESARKKISTIVAEIDTHGCSDEEWAGALRAYALDTSNENSPDHARVEQHLGDCEPCKRYVMTLRGLAVALPPPFLPFAHAHLARPLAYRWLRKLLALGRRSTATLLRTGARTRLASVLGTGTVKIATVATMVLTAAGGSVALSLTGPSSNHHTTGMPQPLLQTGPPPPVFRAPSVPARRPAARKRPPGTHRVERHSVPVEARRPSGRVPRPRPATATKPSRPVPAVSTEPAGQTPPAAVPSSESRSGEFGFEQPNQR